jgi:hypothetical protein
MSKTLAEELEDAFERCRSMDASLGERLQALAESVRQLSPPFAETVERLISRLQQSDAGTTAPRPGDPMPLSLPQTQKRLTSYHESVDTSF